MSENQKAEVNRLAEQNRLIAQRIANTLSTHSDMGIEFFQDHANAKKTHVMVREEIQDSIIDPLIKKGFMGPIYSLNTFFIPLNIQDVKEIRMYFDLNGKALKQTIKGEQATDDEELVSLGSGDYENVSHFLDKIETGEYN